MSQIYLYAIIPAGAVQRGDLAGLWPAEPRVWTIGAAGIAAVVSASPPVDFHHLPRDDAVRYLLDHQRVIEEVMRTSSVLPVKFGTVLPDEAAVVRLLARGDQILTPRLDELSQHLQVELVVSWSLEEVFAAVAAEDAVARLRTQVAGQEAGAAIELRVALGRLVKRSIDRKRASLRDRILGAVRPIVADIVENALMDDGMVVNLALLLSKQASEVFDARLARLDGELEGRLNFRCVGPLPPYSFATVEVALPSFEVIDQARRALNLGEKAGREEIKSAYHRLIRRIHPDIPTRDHGIGEHAAKLADAYKMLMNYAEALRSTSADGGAAPTGCGFDRGTVEDAILLAVRRQEFAPPRAEDRP